MGNLGASTWAMVACLHLYQQTFPQFQFSIPQNTEKASICHILEKNDRLVSLKNQTAWQIYNHFRAYKNFPGTTFMSEYFKQEVKVLELDLDLLNQQSEQYQLTLKELLNNSGILEEKKVFGEFLKLKNQVFLICKDQTLLPIKTAQLLENNNRVALGGFNFK
jgi:methionyl-tRNA formyltransferase